MHSGFEGMAKITEAVINRRYFVADERAGIVMGTVFLSHFQKPGNGTANPFYGYI